MPYLAMTSPSSESNKKDPTSVDVLPKRKIRVAILLLVAICLSLFALAIWESWTSRQYHLRDKEVAMANLAQTLSSHAQSTIKQADTILFSLVDRLQSTQENTEKLVEMERLLAVQRKELPQLHGLFVYDENGRWVINSNAKIPLNADNSDREYFTYHRQNADMGPHIGPSIKSRTTGEWVMPVSRRYNKPDGSFAGVVLATISLKYFLDFYNSIDLGENGVINLISSNAEIILRRPFNDAVIGTSVVEGPLFTQLLPRGPFGTAIVPSHVDGVQRVVGYRRVAEYPLVIFTAVNKDEVLASWRQKTFVSAGIVICMMIILGAIGARLIRLMTLQDRVQQDLMAVQEKMIIANKALETLALEDALTGLANRRQFDLFIKTEMGRAKRNDGKIALMMVDVDHFKSFNDDFGHLAGDECLRMICQVIKQHIRRPGDLAARYGGEEFSIVLPDTDYVGAFLVAEKIRKDVAQSIMETSESSSCSVTVSIGIAAHDGTLSETSQSLIDAADKALYAAKNSGRNITVISNREQRERDSEPN